MVKKFIYEWTMLGLIVSEGITIYLVGYNDCFLHHLIIGTATKLAKWRYNYLVKIGAVKDGDCVGYDGFRG